MTSANFLIIPSLLLLYLTRTKKLIIPIVIAFTFLYIKDIFLFLAFQDFPLIVMISFLISLCLLILFALSSFQKDKIHPVEYISFFIMYGFLLFLFIFIGDMIPEIIPTYTWATYVYLSLLLLFLAISFTGYLIKSHFASLWLMLAAASLLISELSLFFKMYIIEDLSVNIFFPVFHVFAYYALMEHALHRRRSQLFPIF